MALKSVDTNKSAVSMMDTLNNSLHIAREFSDEIGKMLRAQGLPILNKPGNFPDISKSNITEFSNEKLNQLQSEFVNAAGYVNNRLAIARVELNYQKHLIKLHKANLEIKNIGKKAIVIKQLIATDKKLMDLEGGREYLNAICQRYTVYYELYTANQAVLSREQSRRGAQQFHRTT